MAQSPAKKYDHIESATVPDPNLPRCAAPPEPPVSALEASKLQEPKPHAQPTPGRLPVTSKKDYVPKSFKVIDGKQVLNANTGLLGYAVQVRGQRHTFANDQVISEMGFDIATLKRQGVKLEEVAE